jgi:hypothetical protein
MERRCVRHGRALARGEFEHGRASELAGSKIVAP